MKMFFCAYRNWSINIYNNLNDHPEVDLILVKSPEELENNLKIFNPSLVFFIGWSWILEKEIVENNYCICLHPSKLPKYRGGSPIQHQIINGEETSAVTLFKMNEYIDKGNILFQQEFSLEGDLSDVFKKIVSIGTVGVNRMIDQYISKKSFVEIEQDFKKGSYYRRRKPHMSEIKISDFKHHSAKQIHNKIRALQDPYPNAYVICADGKKLYLYGAKIDD